jgi:hypothetical protein
MPSRVRVKVALAGEVASAVAYLLGPEAASVTGIDLTMGAGSTAGCG